jgi:Subtilase family
MGSGEERARTALKSNKILRPKLLLLSAALAALIVTAPAGDRTSALAMNLGSDFGASRYSGAASFNSGAAGRLNRGPRVSTGNFGSTGIGNGRAIGIVGRGDPGKGSGLGSGDPGKGSGNPCKPGRDYSARCVVNNGGDRPGGGDGHPRYPHPPHFPIGPIWTAPILPSNPTVVTTQPTSPGLGSQPPSGSPPPSGSGPQAIRRSGSGVPPVNEQRYVPDEVVVELAATTTNQQTDALARRQRLTRMQSVTFQLGGTTLVRWRIADRRSVPAVVRALETDATVLSAQPNYLFGLQDEAAKPAAPSEGDPAQYMLEKMHLPQAHEIARGNKILVAVIDSGIDVAHPDLAGDIAGTFDALGTGPRAHPHGTAIAGAIAAHGRLMGAAPAAQILAVRAFSGTGGADDGNTFSIMTGLNWAVSHGARVVNMSFAGPQDPGIARSLAAAHEKGVVLVAAAGNKGAKSPPLYPAADPNVIAVTSTDASDQLPAFANRGRHIAVAAPGVDLMLLAPNGTLQFASGTSFSAAYVSGTVALMLERKPDLLPDSLRQALTGTAHHLGPDKAADDQSGAGLVDAYQAVLSLAPAPIDAANMIPAAARP